MTVAVFFSVVPPGTALSTSAVITMSEGGRRQREVGPRAGREVPEPRSQVQPGPLAEVTRKTRPRAGWTTSCTFLALAGPALVTVIVNSVLRPANDRVGAGGLLLDAQLHLGDDRVLNRGGVVFRVRSPRWSVSPWPC